MNQLEAIKKAEEQLDFINGEHGNKQHYCVFCESTEYNGLVGVIHMHNCVIKVLRRRIKELEELP